MTGGISVAACDLDGDGEAEIVTGAGPGGGPHVRVWNIFQGSVFDLADFFAYVPSFLGGVFVAAGDVGGRPLIVTGAGPGGGPHVRAFTFTGIRGFFFTAPVADFFAYDPAFTGGVRVAIGDTDGDGRGEVITGAGPGGGLPLRTFDLTRDPTDFKVKVTPALSFFAYDPSFTGGVFVAGFNR